MLEPFCAVKQRDIEVVPNTGKILDVLTTKLWKDVLTGETIWLTQRLGVMETRLELVIHGTAKKSCSLNLKKWI